MALLGALAAAGGGRRGCVLRVAADAITFYCGGDVPDDGGGTVDRYLRAAEAGRLAAAAGGAGGVDGVRGRYGDYSRPVRSLAASVGDGAAAAVGRYLGVADDNVTTTTTTLTAATALANLTAGHDPYLNGSYNLTAGADGAENLTNYIFVISIGIILGAMILTTICGELRSLVDEYGRRKDSGI